MKNTRQFMIYIFLLLVVLFLGEAECRGGRGGGGGGRGGGRSSGGRSGSRSYGGAGGTSFSSGSSSGSGLGKSAYWIFVIPAVVALIVIFITCVACIRRKNAQPTFQPATNINTNVACIRRKNAKPTFQLATNNNSNSLVKNAYNKPVKNNFFRVQERKAGTYGYDKTIQNNLRIPECKVAMPLSGESGYKIQKNNTYLPPVHGSGSIKPAQHQNSRKPGRKKQDVFIL